MRRVTEVVPCGVVTVVVTAVSAAFVVVVVVVVVVPAGAGFVTTLAPSETANQRAVLA
ncbi:hypothetical protein GCM10007888_17800 [Methylobacterium oxalidis]|uniref:Uncharacterized protein n=1 Tax=Methylobacterium oxalidis TaxID=944322 RepID=A0ABQ6DK87_9HYPH|nr:hypothetical protein LDDCCGHA_3262 [Methylobacterium oxalidis]GLS63399.1 hypothetical protein GCM10007888_17800 [Methylobacterium oxalidis]